MGEISLSQKQRTVGRFAMLLNAEAEKVTMQRLMRVVSFYLGDRIQVGCAFHYIFHYARMQGYKIPAYPLAGNGEIKEFFADEGVKNVPEWYAKIGITGKDYEKLPGQTAVVVTNARFKRKLIVLDGIRYKQDKGFLPLAESGVCAKMTDGEVDELLGRIFDFLESETDGVNLI